MELAAAIFRRARWVYGIILVVMTGLAIWGYLPKSESLPTEERFARDRNDRPERQGNRRNEQSEPGETLSDSFNLDRSDAFLVVECDDFFRPESAQTLRAMVDAVEALPLVESLFWIDSIPRLNFFGLADPIYPENSASPDSFRAAREKVLAHPLAVGQLISPDARTMMMPIVYDWIHLEENEELTQGVTRTAREAIASIREKLLTDAAHEGLPEFRIRITGDVPLFLAQESAFDRNQLLFRGIGYGMAFVLSVFFLRGVSTVLIVSLAPMLGVFWTFGLMNLFDEAINPLANIVMPLLVSMIGLTDGIHLAVNIRRARHRGDDRLTASEHAIRTVGPACFLTSLTTGIGFASLVLAESEYIRDFGRECTWGVVVAFVAVITFIPLLASTPLGKNFDQGEQRDPLRRLVGKLQPLLDAIIAHKRLVSVVAILITLSFGGLATTLRPDNRIGDAMPGSSEAYQALAHCDTALGGIEFIQVIINWPAEIDRESPKILSAIRSAESLINEEPLLQHPLSVQNMLSTFPGDPNDLQTQMTFLSLLPRELRSFFYRPVDREAILVARIQDRGIGTYVPIFRELRQALHSLPATSEGFQFRLRGGPIRRGEELYQIVSDLAISLITASIVILAVLTIAYRSFRLGAISIIPNLFPLVATATLLVLLGRPLNFSSVCAFVVCLGIAVDDTIHFLSRYRQERASHRSLEQAIGNTFHGVGSALVMTTIILVAGFSAMTLSDLYAHRIFATMACCTIGSALVGDLIALPALLAWFDQREESDSV